MIFRQTRIKLCLWWYRKRIKRSNDIFCRRLGARKFWYWVGLTRIKPTVTKQKVARKKNKKFEIGDAITTECGKVKLYSMDTGNTYIDSLEYYCKIRGKK